MMKQEQVRRLLVRAERARKHLMQPHFTRIGLTFGQGHARILDVLLARDHITQKELSDLCHMDVTTMSRSLDRLEESGYLVREKDPGCRRSYLICLTGDGAAEARRVRKVLEMVDEVIWNGLDQDEMEAFCGTMEKYAETWRNAILNLMSRKRKGKPPGQNRTIPAGRFSCLYVYFIHTISSVCRFHLLLVQICTDIIQHLLLSKSKACFVLPAEIWAQNTPGWRISSPVLSPSAPSVSQIK